VIAIISNNISWDYEPSYNLFEYEECCSLTIIFNGNHDLFPFSKSIHGHDNTLVPPIQSWVTIHKIYPPLDDGIDDDDWVKSDWLRAHFLSKRMERLTLLNRFNTIFKN
jgi:hypothetical protein